MRLAFRCALPGMLLGLSMQVASAQTPPKGDEPERWCKGAVFGQLVDARGRPVAGIRVQAETEYQRPFPLPCHSGEAFTDSNGRFRIEPLAEPESCCKTKLFVEVPGFAPARQTARHRQKSQRIVLEPEQHLDGVVVDSQGRLVTGAEVSIEPLHSSLMPTAEHANVVTDATGAFRFSGLGRETYRITASLPSPEDTSAGAMPPTTLDVTLPRRRPAPLKVQVRSPVLISGRVTGPLEPGWKWARVVVNVLTPKKQDNDDDYHVEVTTTPDGRFSARVPPDARLELHASCARSSGPTVKARPGDTDVVLPNCAGPAPAAP